MISMLWEPVLDASDGSSGGNGRGRGTRRSSSIIAGRRPSRTSAKPEEEKTTSRSAKDGDSDDDRPRTPRRRRRTTTTKTETKPVAERADEDEESSPARGRRRSRAADAEPEEEVPTAEAELEEPAAEDVADEEPEAVVETAPRAPSRPARTGTSSNGAASGDFDELRSLVEHQGKVLNELRAGLLTLGQQLDRAAQKPRMGVFVDVPNLMYGQGPDEKPVNMGRLLDFLRQGRDIVRATAYSPVSDNPSEPLEQQKFVAPFVPYEYRIVTKPLKRFADGSIKGNFDVEMAIDMLTMADRLDVIAIVSGDADFARAVEVVQTRGVRVEVVAFAQSSSLEMRSLADRYVELGAVINQIV
jgi:uncharacterized LabA/DUF88 family protein